MSWSRRSLLLGTCGLALSVSGCIRPLYGPTASGVPLQKSLAAVDVLQAGTAAGQERLGHYVRSELIYDLDGSGTVSEKKYRLTLDAADTVQVTSAERTTGRADAALINATVRYTLTTLDGRVLTTGVARTTATYFRDPQRYANVRAARDAEIRAATTIAEDIKQRLAALFATTS